MVVTTIPNDPFVQHAPVPSSTDLLLCLPSIIVPTLFKPNLGRRVVFQIGSFYSFRHFCLTREKANSKSSNSSSLMQRAGYIKPLETVLDQ